jgi:ABC-2 type transport system ATP-binding protein
MTDRPHTFTVRSSDDRALASALIFPSRRSRGRTRRRALTVRTNDFGAFSRA